MKIIDKRTSTNPVRFDDLKHGDVFTIGGHDVEPPPETYIPMMRFDDGPNGEPIAICLDNGDWFHYGEAKFFDCFPVEATVVIQRNK